MFHPKATLPRSIMAMTLIVASVCSSPAWARNVGNVRVDLDNQAGQTVAIYWTNGLLMYLFPRHFGWIEVPAGETIVVKDCSGREIDRFQAVHGDRRVITGARSVRVPYVINMSKTQAEELLRKAGLVPVAVLGHESPIDQLQTVYDCPLAGQMVKEGSEVRFSYTVYRVDEVRVPKIYNLPKVVAEKMLRDAGLIPEPIAGNECDTDQVQTVYDVPLVGHMVPRGSVVRFTHTVYRVATVLVPDVHNLPKAEAIRRLEAAGLVAEPVAQPSTLERNEKVFDVPQAGQHVPRGSVIRFYYFEFAMPRLTGEYEIRTVARNRHLKPGRDGVVSTSSGDNAETVILEPQADGSYRIRLASGRYLHSDCGNDRLLSDRYQPNDDFTRFYFEKQRDGSYFIRVKASLALLHAAESGDRLVSTRFQPQPDWSEQDYEYVKFHLVKAW